MMTDTNPRVGGQGEAVSTGSLLRRGQPVVRAKLRDGTIVRAVGREADALLLLVTRGANGVRAKDFPGGPAYRLSGYIHDLRRAGVPILTDRERHPCGTHGVYRLLDPNAIVSLETLTTGENRGVAT